MKDRADFARRGIAAAARSSCSAVSTGIAFIAENPRAPFTRSPDLRPHPGSPRSAKYNEFENLRVAGFGMPTCAATRYDRSGDVTAAASPTPYAQTLGTVFAPGPSPYEVEIVVAEVGADLRRPDLSADL